MNTKLKCLLLDDELPALSYIKVLCENIPNVEVVKAFNDPEKFLEAIRSLDFNTCILDIQMPGINGLEVATHLKDKLIIFTTAYKEFAAEAFDLNAVDYIRKPIQKERFEKSINKAFSILRALETSKKSQVLWNTDKGKTLLNFSDMLYITSSATDSRDKIVYLKNGSRTTLKNISFEQMLQVLPENKFCRINKKDVIALSTVQNYTSEDVFTTISIKPNDNITLPLSDVYSDEFRQKIQRNSL